MTHHGGVNQWVRNKLREQYARDDIMPDQAWASLIEKADRRYDEGKVSGLKS